MKYPKRLLLAPLLAMLALGTLSTLLTLGVRAQPASNSSVADSDASTAPAPSQPGNIAEAVVQAAAVYSYTGYTLITPTIDGIFGGTPVDYDGTSTPLAGAKTANSPFIELKPFDAADGVYMNDFDVSFTWTPGDSLWIDKNGNGGYDGLVEDIIAGAVPGAGVLVDGATGGFNPAIFLAFNDVEHEDTRAENNRYDDGEDIYVIDDLGEFRGGQHILVPDPDDVTASPIAHAYWIQDANYIYFHNDFLVDADTTFYGGGGGTPATAGFIDGDGIATSGIGTPSRIGFTTTTFFSITDQVAWFDADGDSTWSPAVDALWLDSGTSVPPAYTLATDSIIVYAGGVLPDGQVANAWLSPDTYDFAYHDENYNTVWDSGEDIWAFSGDEQWDYNYFDNELNWLIDGDGSASAGRGIDEPTRYDGNTWFQAVDRVFWYNPDIKGEWNSATNGLWQDVNGDGRYQSVTDTLLYAGTVIPENTPADMRLLERIAVDGDGSTTDGAGSAPDYDSYRADKMPRPFSASDNVVWLDADQSYDWTTGDGLWFDGDQDSMFSTLPGNKVIITSTGLISGVMGTRLTFANHWIGYHDGEVTYNDAYDSGEDIYASNSYFAYDDFEITPDHRYTNGEDIYDRDWLEIWVYAEGENTTPFGNPPEPAPDYEPALRDVGFRVHLNGARIDDPPPALATTRVISDYEAAFGIQAAAGWGPSRGVIGPLFLAPGGDPMWGVYNRHYEYRLPRKGALSSMSMAGHRVTMPLPPSEEILDIVVLPDCSIWAYVRWKDIRRTRGGGGFTGDLGTYDTSSGEDWVLMGEYVHPPPDDDDTEKNDINDEIFSDGEYIDSFFDVFFEVPFSDQPTLLMIDAELTDLKLVGYASSSEEIHISEGYPGTYEVFNTSGEDGWMDAYFQGTVDPALLDADDVQLDNSATVDPPDDDPESSGDSTTINPQPRFELIKQVITPTVIRPTGMVVYEILYSNIGTLGLGDVRITDTLPTSTTDAYAYPNGDFAVDSFFDITYEIDPGSLLPGQSGRAQVAVQLSPTLQSGMWFTNTLTCTHRVFAAPVPCTGYELAMQVQFPIYLPLVLRQY